MWLKTDHLFCLYQVQKEYRKMLRRHPWLSKCLGCVDGSAGGSTGGSGTGSGSGSGCGKERRSSLYTGSNGNPVGSHGHSHSHAHTQSTDSQNPTAQAHGTSVGTHHTLALPPAPSPLHQGIRLKSRPLLTALTYAQVGGWELGAGALLYTHIHCFSFIIQIIHFLSMLKVLFN